jgi:hypothetical protein
LGVQPAELNVTEEGLTALVAAVHDSREFDAAGRRVLREPR